MNLINSSHVYHLFNDITFSLIEHITRLCKPNPIPKKKRTKKNTNEKTKNKNNCMQYINRLESIKEPTIIKNKLKFS